MTYAKDTEVSAERSQVEIAGIVRRYGAESFVSGYEGDRAMVQFGVAERRVRFLITLPAKSDRRFTHHSRGARSPEAATKEWEQACRQKWRALALVIKAKLEAIEAGIVSFEQEFFPHIIMPDGRTVYEVGREALAIAYDKGEMRPLLPAPGKQDKRT